MPAPTMDPLVKLLRRADEAAPAPLVRLDLADLAAKQNHRKTFALAAAAVLCVASLAWLLIAPSSPEREFEPGEVALLQAEAEDRLQTLGMLRARQNRARLERRIEVLNRSAPVAEQADRLLNEALAALAWRADRLLTYDRAEGARLYRAIAARHPQTRWSEMAKQRLAIIGRDEKTERNKPESKENER